MKYRKANTITPPVFVNNKDLHKLTPILEDTALSNICGGYPIAEFQLIHTLLPFCGLTGLCCDAWVPGALITSVPLVTALIVLPCK